MRSKDFLVLFVILALISSYLLVSTSYNYFSVNNIYYSKFTLDSSSKKDFKLPNSIFYDFYSSDSRDPCSFVDGNVVYVLVNGVEANSTSVKIVKVIFNNNFSAIGNESLISTPLPQFFNSSSRYEGLVLVNNTFLTLQRNVHYNKTSNLIIKHDFFIRFNSSTILSNQSIISNLSAYGINNTNDIAEDYYFPIQYYNNTLFTLREIHYQTLSENTVNYFLTSYSLPNESLISVSLASKVPYYSNFTISPLNQTFITDFFFDSDGFLWFRYFQDYLGGSIYNIYVKFDLSTMKALETLVYDSFYDYFDNHEFNITIQSMVSGYQLKNVSVGFYISFPVSIQSNRIMELVIGDDFIGPAIFLGLSTTNYSKIDLPYLNLSIYLGASLICVIEIIYYTRKIIKDNPKIPK